MKSKGKLINRQVSLQTKSVFFQFLIAKAPFNNLILQGLGLIAIIFCKWMTEEQKD